MSTLLTNTPVHKHAAQLHTAAWCPTCHADADTADAALLLEPACQRCGTTLELSTATEYSVAWGHIID